MKSLDTQSQTQPCTHTKRSTQQRSFSPAHKDADKKARFRVKSRRHCSSSTDHAMSDGSDDSAEPSSESPPDTGGALWGIDCLPARGTRTCCVCGLSDRQEMRTLNGLRRAQVEADCRAIVAGVRQRACEKHWKRDRFEAPTTFPGHTTRVGASSGALSTMGRPKAPGGDPKTTLLLPSYVVDSLEAHWCAKRSSSEGRGVPEGRTTSCAMTRRSTMRA